MFGKATVAISLVAVLAATPSLASESPDAVHFPAELAAGVMALPDLSQRVHEAEDAREAARIAVVEAYGVSAIRLLRARQAQTDLNRFARATYLSGMPSTTGVLVAQWDGVVGDLLHDLVLQRAAGTDQTLRALSTQQDAEAARNDQIRAVKGLARMEDALHIRREQLESTRSRLLQLSAQIGYPDLVLAALSVGDDGCATVASADANPQGVPIGRLCRTATARAEPLAAEAIKWAFARLGAPYACGGVGRIHPLFQFDCSSFVSRAYQDGAGVRLWTGGSIPTTATMLAQGSRFRTIPETELRVGDLVLYDTCVPSDDEIELGVAEQRFADGDGAIGDEDCSTRHVVIYLGKWSGTEWMIHTTSCGKGVTVEPFWGISAEPGRAFLAVSRVTP
jgi:hypothetical protein